MMRAPSISRMSTVLGLWLAAACGAAAQSAGSSGAVAVEPAEVVAGMFYSGATVRVSAVVPADAQVAMVCRGEAGPLALKEKGKILGTLWMNTGDVEFENVPEIYLVHSSAALESLAPDSVLLELGLGMDALAATCDPDDSDPLLFRELVRLKEKEGLWGVDGGAVALAESEPDPEAALATTDFELPASAPPGSYEILVYALGGPEPQLVGTSQVTVRQGGAAAAITTLATENGLLYGILAVVVAVVVGLLTGVVFGLGSKGGH